MTSILSEQRTIDASTRGMQRMRYLFTFKKGKEQFNPIVENS